MGLMYHRVIIKYEDRDKALALYRKINKLGTTFDTGYSPEGINWELDWSIQGNLTAQDILLELEDANIDYAATMVMKSDY